MNGYTSINFSGDPEKRPEIYSGTFVDVINPATGELRSDSFEGSRLSDQEIRYLSGPPETQRILIDKLILNAKMRAKAKLDAKKAKDRTKE